MNMKCYLFESERYKTYQGYTANMKWYKKNNQTKICTQTIQNGVTKKCSIYQK